MSFHHTIKSVRLSCLMNQKEFGESLGVSFTTVNRWENGKCKPNLKAMKALRLFCREHDLDYGIIEENWLDLREEES